MSIPYIGREFTFIQPDGAEMKVRGFGDQNYAVFETLDGHPIEKNPETGFYEIAEVSDDGNHLIRSGIAAHEAARVRSSSLVGGSRLKPAVIKERALERKGFVGAKRRWEIRREEARKRAMQSTRRGFVAAPPQQQTTGSFTGLCLLIEFPDVPQAISQQEVDAFCNKKKYKGFGNNGSVYDYFYDNSCGKLKYSNIVTSYYKAAKSYSYYADPKIAYGKRAQELIREALTALKGNGFDFSKLSSDSGGYVFAINVFYAGNCNNNWAEGLWPHSSTLSRSMNLTPGKTAADYQITDMGSSLTLGTFCHENGHMICDFPDLYDYGYESQGVGVYCLMCAGGLNGNNPAEIGAYLKYKAGWAKKVGNTATGVTKIANKNHFIIHPRNTSEYFIIENRFKSGRDATLPTSGLAIWHVDELGSNNNEQMTPKFHYECSLEQADNKNHLEHGGNEGDAGDLFYKGNNAAFGDNTKPNSRWWDGSPSGLSITEIGAPGATMTCKVKVT